LCSVLVLTAYYRLIAYVGAPAEWRIVWKTWLW